MATYNVQVEDSEGNKYYPKPDLLTTKEQVSANTAAGKSVDALVVKQINSDLTALENQNIHSSSERVVGKWINGKTLYERVITFSGKIDTTGITYTHGIANVDLIYVDNVIMSDTGEGESADTHYWAYSAISVKVDRTALRLRNGISGSLTGTHMAILRYTKTTGT